MNEQINRLNLGWLLIFILTIIPIIIWLNIVPLNFRFNSNYATFTSIGQILGLIGILWYSLSFILNTRLKFLEPLFGGMNRVFITHHIVGGVAFILILLHPLFLSLRYIDISARKSALFLLPSDNWPINFGITALWLTILLLVLTFFVKLPYDLWLKLHKYLGVPFILAGIHGMLIKSDISDSKILRIYILGFVFLGIIAYIYRTLFSKYLVKRSQYIVDEVRHPTKSVTEVILSPKSKPIKYRAGQFVFVRFVGNGVPFEDHPFSLSSSPKDNKLRITMKAVGDYTSNLQNLAPGVVAEIEGGFGRFAYNSFHNPKQLWIAGGIGVTPFLSMSRNLLNQTENKDLDIKMYYSVKSENEFVGIEELQKIFTTTNLELYKKISEVDGNLTINEVIKTVTDIKEREIYICGPPLMMSALRKQLNDIGVKNHKIHTEEFTLR